MSLLPAPAPATYVARCAGLCSEADAPGLHNLLKGMAARRHHYDENEYGMSTPLQSGTKTGTFKMIKMVPQHPPIVPLGPPQEVIWRLVQESPPLTGQPYNSLPASVLEVSESSLTGIYSVQFMASMGCAITYKVGRTNWVYTCSHEGAEVQVSVFVVFERIPDKQQPNKEERRPLFQGHAVEARLTAGPEQQVEAAKKLGTFCQKLLPFVLLKKEDEGVWVPEADDAEAPEQQQLVPLSSVLRVVESLYGQRQDKEHNPHGEHAHDCWQVFVPLSPGIIRGSDDEEGSKS